MDRFPVERLRQFGIEICLAHQVPIRHAEVLIDSLIDADLCGKGTHGLVRLPSYLERVRLGLMDAQTSPIITHDLGALIRADAKNGFGAVAMDWALKELKSRAKSYGISAVILDHSNHVGTLGYWSRSLAMANPPLVSWIVTDASPRLPPFGGVDPILGNNPWTLAFPWDEDRAIVLDMANSVAAAGKIRQAMIAEKEIPSDWALDREGRPTVDPKEALSGLLLPMAGYKGYAITLMIGMMANVLGLAESIEVRSPFDLSGPQNLSQFVMGVDIMALYGEAGSKELRSKIEAWVSRIKESRRQDGTEVIWLPGEQSEVNRTDGRIHGVRLNADTLVSLNQLAESVGLRKI